MLEQKMSQAILGLTILLSCTFATGSALAADVKNINVDCNKPNASIQNEIDKVKSGEAITIYIVGICNESVNIIKDDITLSGNEAGNECDKTNPGGTGTINGTVIVDSVRAKIEHLTITGSDDGIGIINRATAQLNCNDISNNEASGVYVLRSSNAVLRNNRVSGNGTRETNPGVFFDCGLFAADASSVDSRGNTYSDNQYCAIEIDRQAAFRNGAFLPRRPGEQANPAERDTFIEKGCDPSTGAGCFNEFTENDTVAIIAFNGGLIDLRNADISGFVEVEGLSSYRVDGDATAQGHIYNDVGSLVRIRDRGAQFPGRKVTYKGTLSCFNGAQTLYSNVQCGQTCNGDIPGTCFFAP